MIKPSYNQEVIRNYVESQGQRKGGFRAMRYK
jgi:hypothetical protein